MNRVNFIGHNIKSYWGLIWEINNNLLVLSQGILGGLFIQVIGDDGETILTWPSTYHKEVMLTQFNFLADRLLTDSIRSVKSVEGKKGFTPNLPEPIDFEDEQTRILICDQMTEWVEKTFPGPNWNYWSHNFIHIADFDEVELLQVWENITKERVKNYKPGAGYKPYKQGKEPDEDADQMYKEATEGIEGDHDEWAKQFEGEDD